jgi:hypothetical protein
VTHIQPQASARLSSSGRTSFRLQAVLLSELLDAAGGVNEFLFAGKKGMAVGANFDVDAARRRAGFYHVAAGAYNRRVFVFGMDSSFHNFLSAEKVL